ncbi:hypothetical protein FQN49_001122 [Arthroderma sp. PD_2]|nr:hypothetical protein FQN49_001122 [Arthroderma sp. PD_2]
MERRRIIPPVPPRLSSDEYDTLSDSSNKLRIHKREEIFKNITISDDRSNQMATDRRNLLALGKNVEEQMDDGRRERSATRRPHPRISHVYESDPDTDEEMVSTIPTRVKVDPQRERRVRQERERNRQQPGVILLKERKLERQKLSRLQDNLKSQQNSAPGAHYLQTDSIAPEPGQSTTVCQTRSPNDISYTPDIDGVKFDGTSSTDVQELLGRIASLKLEVQRLESTPRDPVPSRYQVLYRLSDDGGPADEGDSRSIQSDASLSAFLDPPELIPVGGPTFRLRCNDPVGNLDLYLAKNKDISFIVFRTFATMINSDKVKFVTNRAEWNTAPQDRELYHESIQPVALNLKTAVIKILESGAEYKEILFNYLSTGKLEAPYLFIYHCRDKLKDLRNMLVPAAQKQLDTFRKYLKDNFAKQYGRADFLLEREEILPEYLNYLFKPGDVLVKNDGKECTGYIAKSWPSLEDGSHGSANGDKLFVTSTRKRKELPTQAWSIEGWSWKFNGTFFRENQTLQLGFPSGNHQTKEAANAETGTTDSERIGVHITELSVYPIRYAPKEIVELLRKRGRTFWKCRVQRLVCYQTKDQDSLENIANERYMIDMKTYLKLHPDSSSSYRAVDSLDAEIMEKDEAPGENFELLMPTKIKGYNLRRKKWYELVADQISDVIWNKESFQSLVMDPKAKDLIQALVSNQLEGEKSTDLIVGKGNGLILLLHGGPGTGKTLTAESVAEIAEKPLYRVTCGDVGVQAEAVEKYLESVLHLGKVWGCVVLLDEADVFLEQRSLEDLARNALVSVFLRVLEYYDGILILTSNRVGTFDEAFKSRIQLALHYPSLGPKERSRIWRTFIDRLDSFEDDEVDIEDLRSNLNQLKQEKMNGREIRNTITTARQYSRWKGTALTYTLLKDVIDVSKRFDTYLDGLNDGYSQEELAADSGLR